jgi:hypothetical protein
MEITINGVRTTLTTEQGKALWRALGYQLNHLLNALPTRPKTPVTVLLSRYQQDESDPNVASVVPSPTLATFAIRVRDLAADVAQAEALRIWKRLELQFNEHHH